MDRINDQPPAEGENLADNDHGILGAPGQNAGSENDQDRILGGGETPAGSAPVDGLRMPHTASKPSAPEPSEAETKPDDDEPIAGRLDSDANGTESVHIDTGSGSNNLTGAATGTGS